MGSTPSPRCAARIGVAAARCSLATFGLPLGGGSALVLNSSSAKSRQCEFRAAAFGKSTLNRKSPGTWTLRHAMVADLD
jgi:hypothetical protein